MWYLLVLSIISIEILVFIFFYKFGRKTYRENVHNEAMKEIHDITLDMCNSCYYKKRCQELEKDDSNKNE